MQNLDYFKSLRDKLQCLYRSKVSGFMLATLVLIASLGCSHNRVQDTNSNTETKEQVEIMIDKKTNKIVKRTKTVPVNVKKPLFDWPVWEARMSRGYLPRGTKRRRRPHKGIDLAAQRGSAVMASTDGIVIYTGKGFKGYGKMIMIETIGENAGFATLYGHLDKIVVFEGQKVSQGEVIGALGNTGRSSGPHLHFEIRKLEGPVDPLPYLPAGEALTNDVDDPTAPEE
jgi:murein DD-endopeptidase MepM/ murein hydrolase activator NlpD